MAVLLVGDTHCNIRFIEREVIPTAVALNIKELIQVGDFGYWPNFPDGVKFLNRLQELLRQHGMTLTWIDGNHENHPWLRKIYGNVRELTVMHPHDRITYAPRGAKWQLGDRKFLACGGAYSIDRAYRKLDHTWFVEELVEDYDVRTCKAKGKVDVLLTHDAPGGFECSTEHGKAKDCPETNDNRQRLFKVFANSDPKIVFHGHWHERQINVLEGPSGPVDVVGLGHDGGISEAMAVLYLDTLKYEFVPKGRIPVWREAIDLPTDPSAP